MSENHRTTKYNRYKNNQNSYDVLQPGDSLRELHGHYDNRGASEYPGDKYHPSSETSSANPDYPMAKETDENLLPIKVDDLDDKMAPPNALKPDLQ